MDTQNLQQNQVMQNLIIKSSTDNSVVISGYASVYNISDQHKKYLIKNCRLSSLEFEQFSSFFRARRGGNFAFRFRDNIDYQVSRQIIGKCDGELTQFQLVKLYEDPILPYARTISKPVFGSGEFYVNDINTEVQVDYNTGVSTLPKPLDKDQILTGNFIFDVAVRFANDSFANSCRHFVTYRCITYTKRDLDFTLRLEPNIDVYNQSLLQSFSKNCRANFGDLKCKIDKTVYSQIL